MKFDLEKFLKLFVEKSLDKTKGHRFSWETNLEKAKAQTISSLNFTDNPDALGDADAYLMDWYLVKIVDDICVDMRSQRGWFAGVEEVTREIAENYKEMLVKSALEQEDSSFSIPMREKALRKVALGLINALQWYDDWAERQLDDRARLAATYEVFGENGKVGTVWCQNRLDNPENWSNREWVFKPFKKNFPDRRSTIRKTPWWDDAIPTWVKDHATYVVPHCSDLYDQERLPKWYNLSFRKNRFFVSIPEDE